MKTKHLLSIIIVLLAVLILLVCIACSMDPKPNAETQPSTIPSSSSGETTRPSESTTPTTVPPTTVPPTTIPPTTVPPTTQPTAPTVSIPPSWQGIGLYTRAELEALPTKSYGFGPGKSTNGKRAPYAESEQIKYGQYGANFIAPDNGNIYLTFDCGYEYTATNADGSTYRVTAKILDVLKEKNVKAVFFVTMHYVKSQPDLVQRMIDEGHIVGNHSNNHPVMPKLSIDKMIQEVMTLHDYVLEHFSYEMFLFRPPTGEFSVQSLAVVHNLGYKNVHWSFAYVDYDTANQPDEAGALANVTSSAHSGAIYLLHAVSVTNANILGDAIDSFREQGYNLELFY